MILRGCMKRCPKRGAPAADRAQLELDSAAAYRARIDTIGRAKEIDRSAQRMLLGKGIARITAGRSVFSRVAVASSGFGDDGAEVIALRRRFDGEPLDRHADLFGELDGRHGRAPLGVVGDAARRAE